MFDVLLQRCIFFKIFQMLSLTLENTCEEYKERKMEARVPEPAEIGQSTAASNSKQKASMSGATNQTTRRSEVKALLCPLPRFEFSECDIQFVGLIGEGSQANVFRIACGGKTYACKIYKYEDFQVDIGIYPRPNMSFNQEALAYFKTSQLQGFEIPQCYGYVELTKIPQLEKCKQENTYEENGSSLPLYMEFAAGRDVFLTNDVKQSLNLLEYFQNAPGGSCILRGIVLEEITNTRSLSSEDGHLPSKLADSGVETLKKLHRCGVLHHDLLNVENTLVVTGPEGERVIFLDFSLAEFADDFKPKRFEEMARSEVRMWLHLFSKYALS